jgi:hypothetical protein
MMTCPEPSDDAYWREQHAKEAEADRRADLELKCDEQAERIESLEQCIARMANVPGLMLLSPRPTEGTPQATFIKTCCHAQKTLKQLAGMHDVEVL